jgi:hypothetical protein
MAGSGQMRKLARMKLGVIADIHGNEVALRAVLKDADRVGVDRWSASWLLLEDDGDPLNVTHLAAPFDVDAVVGDLRQRRHPNAEYITSILTAQAVSG